MDSRLNILTLNSICKRKISRLSVTDQITKQKDVNCLSEKIIWVEKTWIKLFS